MCENIFGTNVDCIYSLISFFIASFGLVSASLVILDFSDDGKLRTTTIVLLLITNILIIIYNLKDI